MLVAWTAFAAGPSRASDSDSAGSVAALTELPVLQARLQRVSAEDDAKYAMASIEQARRALVRAGQPELDPAAAARSLEIGRASLVLAERQLERRRTQEALFETQRRLTATKERATAQRRVLEALLRERAALAREAERP